MICKTAYKKDVKNACEFIIVSVILYPGLYYRARHLLTRDQKTPPLILYIKASTVDDEYCLTQLFHQVISLTDKKPRARYSTKDEH